MSTSYGDNPSPHATCKIDDFLNLLETLGTDIELWSRVEGSGPCVVNVGVGCTERDAGIGTVELYGETWWHHDAWYTASRRRVRHVGGAQEYKLMGYDGGVQ